MPVRRSPNRRRVGGRRCGSEQCRQGAGIDTEVCRSADDVVDRRSRELNYRRTDALRASLKRALDRCRITALQRLVNVPRRCLRSLNGGSKSMSSSVSNPESGGMAVPFQLVSVQPSVGLTTATHRIPGLDPNRQPCNVR